MPEPIRNCWTSKGLPPTRAYGLRPTEPTAYRAYSPTAYVAKQESIHDHWHSGSSQNDSLLKSVTI